MNNETPHEGEQYRHYNGNIYTVLFLTNYGSKNEKYPLTVVYEGKNGNKCSRHLSDWHRSFTLIQ